MKNNKVKWLVLTVALLTIVTITVVRLIQIEENYQKNITRMEECIKSNGTLEVVTKRGVFSSSSSVHCGK